jgi:hypothetical protein
MMSGLGSADWLIIAGLGAAWLGVQIAVNGGLPRVLRRGEVRRAEKGTPEAFMLFWMDQYSFIGLTLAVGGVVLAAVGVSQ